MPTILFLAYHSNNLFDTVMACSAIDMANSGYFHVVLYFSSLILVFFGSSLFVLIRV
jgi:hypothetical protein